MKFRDPKTGEAMTVEDAVEKFCAKNRCDDNSCVLGNALTDGYEECFSWVWDNPAEAARLMGYKLVDGTAKHDTGKPRPTLVPVSLINAVTAVREYGTQKYGDPENWRNVEVQRYRDALYRHWLAYLGGERIDPESGLPHMHHVACNTAFIIELDGEEEQ